MKKLLFILFVNLVFLFSQSLLAETCMEQLLHQKQEITKWKFQYLNEVTVYQLKEGYLLVNSLGEELLLHRSKPHSLCQNTYKVKAPLERALLSSSTYVFAFSLLNKEKAVHAVTNWKDLSRELKNRLPQKVNELHFPLRPEEVLRLKGDLLLPQAVISKEIAGLKQLEMLKIPYFQMLDYKEVSPLARAEWLKIFGILLGEEKKADQLFLEIEKNYLREKVVAKTHHKVLVGSAFGGQFYHPTMHSNFITLLTDAGGELLLSKERLNNKAPVVLKQEEVLQALSQTNLWILMSSDKNKKSLRLSYPLLKEIHSLPKQIYNITKQQKRSDEGNPFFDNLAFRPDLVLADLKNLLHQNQKNLYWFEEIQ